MMFSDTIGVMLLTHEHYSQFTQRPIGDARRESQALLALSADSRDAVNATLAQASAAGGRADPNTAQDHGFMFGRSVEDPDGNVWEIMWMDPAALAKNRKALSRTFDPGTPAVRFAQGANSEMAPQAFGIARNGLGNGGCGSRRHPVRKPRQLSDVVSASACNSPPIRPFSAS